MKNVYNIENRLKKLSDKRVNPTYKTGHDIVSKDEGNIKYSKEAANRCGE